jgi:hypothetical protein
MNKSTAFPSILTLGALVLALAPVQSVHSATFNTFAILDLSLVNITNDTAGGQLILSNTTTPISVPQFTPNVGDTLITAVTYANGDRLRIDSCPNVVDTIGPTFSNL